MAAGLTMRRIVVSAVNFSEGGPLTILRSCLRAAREAFPPETEIIALVHACDLIEIDGVRTIAFPDAKTSWFKRLVLEYRGFKTLSRDLRPDFWLSLHDCSPRLNGERQAVYCHNPAPFFRLTLTDARHEPSLAVFRFLYGLVYRFNLRANSAVIVQQEWLRTEFEQRYGARNVIVAHPDIDDLATAPGPVRGDGPLILFYPTIPRAFKNIETLCAAVKSLPPEIGRAVELRITIDGHENAYARAVVDAHRDTTSIRFVGRQDRHGMARNYAECDVLAFPSRLETWGLPITEAKMFGKPLLVADLPYAYETVGTYDAVAFLPPRDVAAWRRAIIAIARSEAGWQPSATTPPSAPFADGWTELWALLRDLPAQAGTKNILYSPLGASDT